MRSTVPFFLFSIPTFTIRNQHTSAGFTYIKDSPTSLFCLSSLSDIQLIRQRVIREPERREKRRKKGTEKQLIVAKSRGSFPYCRTAIKMPSHASISLLAMLASVAAAASRICASNTPLSCHNTTAVDDSCCFIPSGQLLQTQFWDTDPSTGPAGK
ncbi:hypothetical protein J3F84DRAFT_254942 [Trichoderma pleuroticola]